jgi:hypothetical protein
MPRWKLFRFLNVMLTVCIHDPSTEYDSVRLEHFQRILACCPRALLTRFLLSIDKQSIVNLLEQRDDLWIKFFVGLIIVRYDSHVEQMLTHLMDVYDVNFGVRLLLLLEKEAKKKRLCLPRELRQKIYNFFCRNWEVLAYLVQIKCGQDKTHDIYDLAREMNRWMRTFSKRNRLNFDPRNMVVVISNLDEN